MTKLGSGYYQVDINDHDIIVMRGDNRHVDSQPIWHLIVDGRYWQSYCTKRQAMLGLREAHEAGSLI